MGMTMKKVVAVLFAVIGVSMLAHADTRYVSDQLEVTMRSGKSTQHNIVRVLKSGTSVELLETDEESGYAKVRLPSGMEGWVLSRFLSDEPIARDKLAALVETAATLRSQLQDTGSNLKQARTESANLDKERVRLVAENSNLVNELTELRRTAANPIAIDEENQALKTKMAVLEDELQTLKHKYQAMEEQTAQNWFMIGAGVVLLGIIIGLLLPNMRFGRRKRSQWGSL